MNVPLAAWVHVVPSGEVSILKSPVEALPPSPHPADGSTAKSATSTAAGKAITTNFGTNTFVGSPASLPVVEPQTVASLLSITWGGPHAGPKSGPLKSAMDAPPLEAAQFRRTVRFFTTPALVTVTELWEGS